MVAKSELVFGLWKIAMMDANVLSGLTSPVSHGVPSDAAAGTDDVGAPK